MQIVEVQDLQIVDSWGRVHHATLNEYNVAQAGMKLQVPFLFQVDFFQGRAVRGGQVLDFLFYAYEPRAIPLQVFGNYWHEGQLASEDQYKLNVLGEVFGKDVEIIWGNESQTFEDALSALRGILF